MMVDAFNALPDRANKADVRTNERAMKRLQKESVKVKDILSANKVADIKVPELLDYVTLRTLMQRSDFEQRAKHLFDRVEAPVLEALDKAGLRHSDIDQIEILGGGLRVPKVLDLIKQATLKSEVSVHLNGDEAMCFGAAFIASNSSSSFKVRKVYLTQHPLHDYRIELKPLWDEAIPEDSEISYTKKTTLFKSSTDYLGQKKTINVSYDKAMQVDVFAVDKDSEEHIATYKLEELGEIAKNEVATKEGSTVPKVSL